MFLKKHFHTLVIAGFAILFAALCLLVLYIRNKTITSEVPSSENQEYTSIQEETPVEPVSADSSKENQDSENSSEETPQSSMAEQPEETDLKTDDGIMRQDQVFTFTEEGEVLWLSITEEELKSYAAFFRNELKLNDAAIAGLLANIQTESGFNPQKVGDQGDAYGICQWHGARLDQMVTFCDEMGYNPISMEGQLHFLVHDLQTNYIYPYDLMLACKDSAEGTVQAAFYFCAYYETPVDSEAISPERENLAKKLIYPKLNEFSEQR